MHSKNTLEHILTLVAEIERYTNEFQKNDIIPRIAIDLALAKTSELYDSLLSLQHGISFDSEKKEDVQNEPTLSHVFLDIPVEIIAQEKEVPEAQRESLKEPDIVEKQELEAKIEEVPVEVPAEKIPQPSEVDITTKMAIPPISSIASAIGINERFQFIKGLFHNNVELYTGAIQELNQLSSFDEARVFLQKKHALNFDDELVQRFLSIIERRYL